MTTLRHRPSILAALAVLVLSPGCSSGPPVSIQTFRVPPEGWTDLDAKPSSPQVARARLDLASDAAFLDPTRFYELSFAVHLAFAGGDPRGLAGIVVSRAGEEDDGFLCLALRPTGEWRVYRSKEPGEPLGGRGWQAAVREAPTGFARLEAMASPLAVEFRIDGKTVERVKLTGRPEDEEEPRPFQVGIFSRGVVSRWKNFLAGRSAPERGFGFEPAVHEDWGDPAFADALVREATTDARAFRSRPTRMGLYAIVASLDEATRIQSAKSPGALKTLGGHAEKIAAFIKDAARGIGETDLLVKGFAALSATRGLSVSVASQDTRGLAERARKAEEAGAIGEALCLNLAAAEGTKDASLDLRVKSLKDRLAPLHLEYSVASRAENPVFDLKEFWQVTHESYGGVPTLNEGELKIRVQVLRSANDAESVKSERRLGVYKEGGAKLVELTAEKNALEQKIPEDTLDAEARANVMRASAEVLGPSALVNLRRFRFGDKERELHMDDGEAIEKSYRRLRELEQEIDEEEGQRSVEHKSVPATLNTNSITVEVAVKVSLDDRTLVDEKSIKAYMGIEQWTHAADPKQGIPASRFRKDVVTKAAQGVRDRILGRFRTAISVESLLSRMEPSERLGFLIRLARAAPAEEYRSGIEWYLKEQLGLEGAVLRRVSSLCLE